MNKYKVCVYAICKNEEQFVDRWMDTVSEADMVVVTDTGSADHTAEKLRGRGAVVYEETISPWRFDTARNIALGHVPKDADICVSSDLDEVFEQGWRRKLEAAWEPRCTRARCLLTWSYNADGSPAKQFALEKIHRRHGFNWVRPVYESLEYGGEDTDYTAWVDGMVVSHRPDPSKPRSQYLSLLELAVEENPQDDRAVFWLGRAYYYRGDYDRCIAALKRHLSLPSALWDEERCASMRFISRCWQNKKNFAEAKRWLFRAIAECPHVREPYLQMARLGYLEKNWPLVFLMTEKGLQITKKTGSYLTEPEAWGYSLYDFGAIGAYRLGMYEKALQYAQTACDMAPDDQRLKGNLALIAQKLKEQTPGTDSGHH